MASALKDQLISLLDKAVEKGDPSVCCGHVKDALENIVASGESFIEESYLRPAGDRYARRLYHVDPAGRYTVLIMVWDQNQGTALHDHAGMWCVECVYRGEIRVNSYNIEGNEDDPCVQFSHEATVAAGPGEAGALIPPFEYHTIDNPHPTPAVTIHVYGGEMTWCHAFIPIEGGYRKERRELAYTE